MENIFLSHRFHGEDQKELEYILTNMKQSLEIAWHKVICSIFFESYFREQKFTTDQIYDYMLKQQEECSVFMPVIWTNKESKGMNLESDLAIKLEQRYILVHKEGIMKQQFYDNCHRKISFSNYEQLFNQLKYFK